MQGRYGIDSFSYFLTAAGAVLAVISGGGYLRYMFFTGILLEVWAIFRCLSRKFDRRRDELRSYLDVKRYVLIRVKLVKLKITERKEYKYVLCGSCDKILRIPKGKGKVTVTCPICGRQYKKRS